MMNLKHKLFFIFFFFSLFGFSQKKALTTTEIKTFKQSVETNSGKITSLEANFSQNKHMDFMEKDIKSSGKLYFKSGNVRWEYTSPYSYYMILKGDKMYINDNGKKKEINMSSSEMLKELSKVISGSMQGKNIFDETRFTITYYKNGSDYLVNLLAKDKTLKKYIKQIEITFDGSSYLVNKVKVTEPSSDYTDITFSGQKKNTSIPDAKFSF